MKLRKVLSLIMAVAMIMTASSAFAFNDVTVDDDAYEAITGLSALNIINGYEDGSFQPEGKITRAEFATIIMRTLGMDVSSKTNTVFEDVTSEHWASGAIQEAYGAGIVNGRTATTFDPEAEVTYEEATKMIVCAMGYQKKAESMVKEGQNPYPTAYNLIANQKGITSGVEKTAGGASRATVAKLVWNALPVNLMDQTSYGSEVSFEEIKDQSLLYTKLNAVLIDAKVEEISLDPEDDKVNFKDVELDDVAEKAGDYSANDFMGGIDKGACDLAGLQGLTVKALVDVSDSDPVVIAVFASSKNKVLEIDPNLFKGVDGNKINYYKTADANTVTTSAKVLTDDNGDVDVDVYVNLVKKSSFSLALDATDVDVNEGDSLLRFVDTDNDGYYDTLFVDRYYSFVVGSVSEEDYEIAPATGSTNYNSANAEELVLDPEDDNIAWSLTDEDGKALELSDINVGDVITYAESSDGSNYYYDITVCKSSAVTGSIDSIKTKKSKIGAATLVYYVIDGTSYQLNTQDDATKPVLDAGSTGTFQITADGKIIAVTLDATTRNFAIAISAAKTTGSFEDGGKLQVMKADGTVETIAFADEYYLNGDETTKKDAENVETELSSISGTPVMYELKSDGSIKHIYTTATAIAKETDNDYKVKSNSSATYNESSEKIDGAYFVESSAVVALKAGKAADKKASYSLISNGSLIDEKSYSYKAVVDENNEVVIMIVDNFTVKPLANSIPLYVTGTSTVSVDGYKRTQIEGLVGKDEVEYVLAEEYEDGDKLDSALDTDIVVGDAIQFTLNGAEEIDSYQHIVKVDGGYAYFLISDDAAKADQDEKGEATAKLVKYSLTAASAVTADTTFTATDTSVKIAGYGAFGRIQRVAGNTVGIFNQMSSSFDAENYFDVSASASTAVYVVSDASYSDGYDVKSLTSLKTFKSVTGKDDDAKMAKTDDVIYILKNDGDVIFQYVIDTLQNNK